MSMLKPKPGRDLGDKQVQHFTGNRDARASPEQLTYFHTTNLPPSVNSPTHALALTLPQTQYAWSPCCDSPNAPSVIDPCGKRKAADVDVG